MEKEHQPQGGKATVVLGRITLVVLGIGFSLVVVEIVLRIFPVPNRFTLQERLEQQWQADEKYLLRLKPNLDMQIYGHPEFSYTVRTNSDGLRDEPFEGDFEIAAIGDSFTFGFGVEEDQSWPAQLQSMSGIRVANLGWAGWNSRVYPQAIEEFAIPLNTHIWLWAFFLNDLPESAGADDFLSSGEPDYLEWINKKGQGSADLSFPFNMRTTQLVAAIFNPELFLLPGSGSTIFEDDVFRMRVSSNSWDVSDPQSPLVQRGWDLTEIALQRGSELAREHNATLMVIFIPSREHVYWPYIKTALPNFDIHQLDQVESRLSEICQDQNIAYLNLIPAFREMADSGEMLYFPSDGHWNADGYRLAAEIVFNSLFEQGLIGGLLYDEPY